MKRNILIVVGICFLCMFTPRANAQKAPKEPMPCNFEPYEKQVEMVLTNLTDSQREALHKLSKENRDYMEKHRRNVEKLQNSIGLLLAKDGDNSEILFPIIEMKAELEAEKEKNLYRMKLKIDSILTPEQRAKMKEYEKRKREQFEEQRSEFEKKRREKMEGSKSDKETNKRK